MISTLEEVPPNWIKVKFEDIARNITKRIDNPAESGLEYYIGLEHLDTDQIRIKRFGSTDDVKATKFLCKKGDIIFGKRNAYLRKVAVTDRDAVVSAHSMIIRPKEDLIIPEFLPCFMQSSVFWKTAHAISEGSMSPTIKWKTLAKQEFWIPSIIEQKKIVEILGAIEGNIEKSENLIKINEKLKEGLLNKLLTKGIGHTKFKQTEFGEIPEEWNIYKIEEIAEAFAGGTPSRINKNYYGNDISWVKSGEVAQGLIYDTDEKITEEGLKNSSAKLVPVNTVLIAMYGATAGKVGILKIEAATNQAVLALLPKKNSFDYRFMYYLLSAKTEELIKSTQGSGQPNLSKKIILDLFVMLPPIEEQLRIVNLVSSFDFNSATFKKNITFLSKIKKKFVGELMNGKLRIPEEALRNVQ